MARLLGRNAIEDWRYRRLHATGFQPVPAGLQGLGRRRPRSLAVLPHSLEIRGVDRLSSGFDLMSFSEWSIRTVASLGYWSSIRQSHKTNNFLALRLAAASLVIYGHAFALGAPCASCTDVFSRYTHYHYSGDIGVSIFFVISGYMIVGSYDKRRDLLAFLKMRLLRIVPAFWMCLLLMVLLGAKLTRLPLSQFLASSETWQYLKTNGLFLCGQYGLPGVVLTTSKNYGAVMDGSIWTLFAEVRLYLVIAIVGACGILSHRHAANLLILGLVLIGIFIPERLPFLGTYDGNWRLAAFFAVGAFLYINRDDVPMSWGLLGLLLLASYLSAGGPNFEVFAGAFIAYGVMMLGYAPRMPLPSWVEDYSYGIYIYGWPIEQVIRHRFPAVGPYRMAFAALILSWITGALSWHCLEKHMLRLKARPTPLGSAVPA
jgi:peptidoglycan/LPS O-acetylase OafA/YrhL